MDAGKSSCNIYFLSHSVGTGRRDGQKPGDVRPTSPHTSTKPRASNPYGKGQGNQWPGGEREKYVVLSLKNEAAFAAVDVDGGQGAEHFWYQLPTKVG